MEGGLRTKGIYKKSYPGKPLITVVTVVRNSAPELGKTVESVINQTYENIEYIIVDGASTDGTIDIIKKYDAHIDYWISEKDNGVYEGMNKAIDLAQGDWINFMNAGDWFYKPDIVQTTFTHYPEDADFLYGDYFFLFSNGKMVPIKANPLDTLWQRMAFSHQSLFTKREVMVKSKFSLKYKSASDYHFIMKSYSEKKKFFYLKNYICVYSDIGISIKHQLRSMIERWKIARKFGEINKLKIDKFHVSIILKHILAIIDRMIKRRS